MKFVYFHDHFVNISCYFFQCNNEFSAIIRECNNVFSCGFLKFDSPLLNRLHLTSVNRVQILRQQWVVLHHPEAQKSKRFRVT